MCVCVCVCVSDRNRVVGFNREKAERLAKLSVQDPILYAIERRREANEINNTKVGRRHEIACDICCYSG